jgi:signal transduction histidine kinase
VTLIEHRTQDRWVQVSERRTTEGGTVAIYTDISELKRHRTETEVARDEAMAATQAKSRFLASMSHELRTPLNAIIGFTRIVMRRSKDVLPEKQFENLTRIYTSAEHLLGLINSILDLSKIEAGRVEIRPTEFTIRPLIELCLKTTEPLVRGERVRLVSEFQDPDFVVFTDQAKLKQIILNLLSNAAKFTEEGEISVRTSVEDGKMRVDVKDTGPGIPETDLNLIFEEFQQLHNGNARAQKGTDLGLSISRQLASLLGGELTVDSKIGVGSTFSLRIPLRLDNGHVQPEANSFSSSALAAPIQAN